ncbi:hypothetical protein G4B88_006286 [Cannabis sativa]|uniref:Reverse transcriptase zinc-binding domain-containing protein n=1 Tax=Cannabis sativa TaxID=3483 RepID=A0A7J6IDX2_CANSA|nr:hypothetical protein G4B88_006286 [Cannabis sativa]
MTDIRKTGAGANHFKTKLLYNNSIAQEQFGSNKVIWSSLNMPKHRFIFWQAINDQLLTRDKFAKFQIALDTTLCPVCAVVEESNAHSVVMFEQQGQATKSACNNPGSHDL